MLADLVQRDDRDEEQREEAATAALPVVTVTTALAAVKYACRDRAPHDPQTPDDDHGIFPL
jgi:hypothetical protein